MSNLKLGQKSSLRAFILKEPCHIKVEIKPTIGPEKLNIGRPSMNFEIWAINPIQGLYIRGPNFKPNFSTLA